MDDGIEFVEGFFEDTLSSLSREKFALIRLDSDSYESTYTSLVHLYPQLTTKGVVIIDDWHLPGCRAAVEDFRSNHGVSEPIISRLDNEYWVKKFACTEVRH